MCHFAKKSYVRVIQMTGEEIAGPVRGPGYRANLVQHLSIQNPDHVVRQDPFYNRNVISRH